GDAGHNRLNHQIKSSHRIRRNPPRRRQFPRPHRLDGPIRTSAARAPTSGRTLRSRRGSVSATPPEAPKDCPLCPRLVAYREENARAHPDWFNGAAPSFGDPEARLLVVGLAPGRTGANRTGRPFTGDYAGELLYGTLKKFGFAQGEYRADPNDGFTLVGAMITNAVRCAPP